MNTSISSLKRPFYIEPGFLIKAGIYAMLLGGIYFSTFAWLIKMDWTRDDYSYGIIIPFIVLYLLWEKKNSLIDICSTPSWFGFVLLIPGIMLLWLGELSGEFFMLYVSSWLIVVSLCWINMGMEKLKIILFPLFFALTMFPLPNFINTKITLQLKIISSKLGVMMMQWYGLSAFREGNVIDLGFTKLQVVDACSGLRYLFPLFVLGILIAYFYRSSWWKKLIIVLSTIPLTIITNSLRIALTGILSEKWGSAAIKGFFHAFEGWVIFIVTLGFLFFEMWILKKIFSEKIRQIAGDEAGRAVPVFESSSVSGSGVDVEFKEADRRRKSVFLQPQFIVSVILLGLTLVLSNGINFREKIPLKRSFNEFPLKIGKWTGTRQTMEQKFIDVLDLSEYVIIDYTDKKGRTVNFYVAYYESQRKGESIHSPATCLRGGGWEFKHAGKALIPLGDKGQKLPVNRALIEKGDMKQIAYYWFPARGRILTNAYQLKWYTFWDALTRQRTDGALVRVIVTVLPDETVADADRRLQAFIRDVAPVLSEFLPE